MESDVDHFFVPDIEEVERIAALDDPVVRNLQITQCYFELSKALLERTSLNANWCTFATWASKQAGQTIRQEDLARALENLLRTTPDIALAALEVAKLVQHLKTDTSLDEIYEAIWRSLNLPKAIARSSSAVAIGNQKVFAEIGYEFARFQALSLSDPTPDADRLGSFCAGLHPGDPPDGQRYLRQAFSHLYGAVFEPQAKRRAELMLLANLEIGYHEQTRLQPEIQAALDDPFLDETQYVQRLLANLFPRTSTFLLRVRMALMRLLGRPPALELAIRYLLSSVQLAIRHALTETVMAINLPNGVRLSLWSDLRGEFPQVLQQITDPELCTLLERIDPTPDSLQSSGAVDWANLPERLHFIADLFRLYQQNQDLCEAPFTPAQVQLLKAGRVPDGPL